MKNKPYNKITNNHYHNERILFMISKLKICEYILHLELIYTQFLSSD